MKDPFIALSIALHSLFNLMPVRNGKYVFIEAEKLKRALERYHSNKKYTFYNLLSALKDNLPHIEKWHIDFESIHKAMDRLAAEQHITIVWPTIFSQAGLSYTFQFSALNHAQKEPDFIVWLTAKTGRPYAQLNETDLIQVLIDNKDKQGLSNRLSHLLSNEPDFLFNLIMKSEANFVKIAHTRLILFLTDQQIARAIVKHSPTLVDKQKEPDEQLDHLIDKLNNILSNGCSVSTLLRNADAKPILDNSIFFQRYQEDQNVLSQPGL